MMSEQTPFAVLLVSASEYRIDGEFRYTGDKLPEASALITVTDDHGGPERQARVRRVNPDERFPIHATDVTPLSPERSVGPRERSRRRSQEGAAHVLNARRGWLR